jgi:hypothetical protein
MDYRNVRETYFDWKKFEDTKGVTKSCKSKDRQHNGQKIEGQTLQWPKDRRTDIAMAKRKTAI